ncbi:glycerophosphoryl diester phosphodiesterase [Vibrio sp. V31_P5A7T61]|uniref:glycerophosphoryl diester phosphodiesterase n=1 Tax=unclassified Vibrio TaxID=2614977 RepID=UPI001372AD14|nr:MULTISPECIES: glycerophosphoryl diester phosphodiesterase [unclassified Vibrio]NAW61292.1 glycerophosphoryl diester phosphodiesterase [Vibrio sp. V31_P5A7T61]NAX02646.1 glycerophosphoryl diester phosphodiesterase [Vibrio sp. V34_P3A8T189]NAX09643.1 glycerophosphoryl diester phosphodiesterase [Vibrio sp. V40_P2S30T141]NAX65178.1 glycerophosphoryl diester phosphodiesterase [Vibrio sp. V32_P6A28T40]
MNTLFAHRGMSSLAPENTLAAFRLCHTHKVQWLECDVDILGDDTIVISHDDTLDRCTNRSGSLYGLSQQDLANIDAGGWFSDAFAGEPIPTFRQFIELLNELKLDANIEIKSCTAGWEKTLKLIEGVIEGLKLLDSDRKVIISSFNHIALYEFKRRAPHYPTACLFTKETLSEDWESILQACQAEYIHPENEGLSREQVAAFKAKGYKVNVYTVNSLLRANQLFNWGVDGVFTDIAQTFPRSFLSAAN